MDSDGVLDILVLVLVGTSASQLEGEAGHFAACSTLFPRILHGTEPQVPLVEIYSVAPMSPLSHSVSLPPSPRLTFQTNHFPSNPCFQVCF